MKTQEFTSLLEQPNLITSEKVDELKTVLTQYPYFQSAKALQLIGLKEIDSFKYNSCLKRTAANTTDRAILFEFISSKNFKNTDSSNLKSEEENILKKEETKISKTEKEEAFETLNLGKPLSFNKSESHSFNEWMQIISKKPIIREKEPSKNEEKSKLIDKFVESNPKITPISKDTDIQNVNLSDINYKNDFMTETLARVYVEQKKFSNAIKAYEILSLKFPKKSGFFADQIKAIKILQKK